MSVTSMIISNFNLVDPIFPPDETDAPLFVDADAVLPLSRAAQQLKAIGRRYAEIIQCFRIVKHDQFSFSNALYVTRQLFGKTAGEYFLRLFAGKRLDHGNIITLQDIIVKG